MPERSARPPLVVIGFDAGDPALMQRWALEGALPTLRSVMDRGLWGRTAGPEMIAEHGIWSSLTSGVSRGRHGYHYHRQLRPGTYDLVPSLGRDLDVRPFWDRLDPDRAVAVIDVPDIAAPRPRHGVQVSEWATHYPCSLAQTEPPALLAEIERDFGPRDVIAERIESTPREDAAILTRLLAHVRRKGEIVRRLLSRDRFDLVFVVFSESHTGGHQFWKYLRALAGSDGDPALDEGIRTIYRAIDEEAGSILALLPPDASVAILGSIGVRSVYPASGLGRAFCRALGYEAAAGGRSSATLSPIALARRVIPEGARAQMSRLLPRAAQERMLSDKFSAGIDWGRTTLFSTPSYYASFFRVNLAEREPRGIVSLGAESNALLDRVEEDLRRLVDPVTGGAAVASVDRTADLFGGSAHAALPDLIAEWAEASHFMERVEHPKARLTQSRCEFHRGSDHSRHGFVALGGPAISPKGDVGEISPLDLAPTFLALLGAPRAPDLPGRSLVE